MKEFITLQLREKDWTFRALDLDQIEQLEEAFKAVSAIPADAMFMPKDGLAGVAQIAHASLLCKHPEQTVESVRKLLTIATIQRVLDAVRGVSSLDPVVGEAPAGT